MGDLIHRLAAGQNQLVGSVDRDGARRQVQRQRRDAPIADANIGPEFIGRGDHCATADHEVMGLGHDIFFPSHTSFAEAM